MKKLMTAIIGLLVITLFCVLAGCEDTPDQTEIRTEVAIPTIASKVYTGETLTADIADTDAYTVTANKGGIHVGEYDVTLTLTDVEKYVWQGVEGADITLTFAVTQADNAITGLTLDSWSENEPANEPTATSEFGTIVYTYAGPDGVFGTKKPEFAGEYTVKATVAPTDDYKGAEATVQFSIIKMKDPVKVVTAPMAQKLTYTGNPQILVSAGAADVNGQMLYKLDNGDWSDAIPSAVAAGNYIVYYKAAAIDEDAYVDSEESSVTVTIGQADNTVIFTTDVQIHCGDALPTDFDGSATFGTVSYTYSTDNVSFWSADNMPPNFVLEAGATLYIKASVTETADFKGGEKVCQVSVSHNYIWHVDAEADTFVCACGDETARFEKKITNTKQRVNLDVVSDGNFPATYVPATENFTLDLTGISEYDRVASVRLGETLLGESLTVNCADIDISVYGQQNFTVTVIDSNGFDHAVSVPVLVVTKVIHDKIALNSFGAIAKATETDANTWGGYFELGEDIPYNDYWISFISGTKFSESDDDKIAAYRADLYSKTGFKGTFDGKGFTIQGLKIALKSIPGMNGDTPGAGAFIGRLAPEGVIKNVSFTDAAIGNDRSLIVYSGSGTVENVYVRYAVFGIDNYDEYNANHLWGSTSTFFGAGNDSGATLRNIIIDVSACKQFLGIQAGDYGYVIGQILQTEVLDGVYLIGEAKNLVPGYNDKYYATRNIAPGDDWNYADSYVLLAEKLQDIALSDWNNDFWSVNGGLPYCKDMNVQTVTFTKFADEIALNGSAQFVAENAVLVLSNEAQAVGIMLSADGTVTVPDTVTPDTQFAIDANSVFGTLFDAEFVFTVIRQRELLALSEQQIIDLDIGLDGSVNETGTVTLDLTEKMTGSATLNSVKVGTTILPVEDVSIENGQLILEVNIFGVTYYGEQVLNLVYQYNDGEYELTVPVLFVSKMIASEQTLQAVKDMSEALGGTGYYMLASNIPLSSMWYSSNPAVNFSIGQETPFNGVIDGNGFTISGLRLSNNNAPSGFIYNMGANGVLKNVRFENCTVGAGSSLLAYTGAGTFENISVQFGAAGLGENRYGEAGWNWGGEGLLFAGNKATGAYKARNILVDFSQATKFNELTTIGKYTRAFGTATPDSVLENIVMTGMRTEFKYVAGTTAGVLHVGYDFVNEAEKGIYVQYLDETNNGTIFPATGWDEEFWTVTAETATITWSPSAV